MFRTIATIFTLASRNLQRRKWRTAITLISLTATVAGFISILAVSQYVSLEVSSTVFDRTVFAGQSVGYPYFSDILITANHPWWSFDRNPSSLLSEDVLTDLNEIPGVDWAEPFIGDIRVNFNEDNEYRYWYVENENGTNSLTSNIFLAGVDPSVEPKRMEKSSLILQGNYFDSESSAIVGFNFAQDNNVSVGDTIVIPTDNLGAQHDTPGGLERRPVRTLWQYYWSTRDNPWRESFSFSVREEIRLKVAGIFWTSTPYDNFVFADYTLLQRAFGFDDKVTTIYVKLSSESGGDVVSKLWLIDDVSIVMPIMRYRYAQGYGVGSEFSGVTPTKFVNVANVQNAIIMEIAATVFIASTVYASVLERRWEIGLLKAIGFKPGFILATLTTESLIVGLISGVLGFLAANLISGLSSIINFAAVNGVNQKFTLEWGVVAILLSVGTITVSSFIPALNAVMVKPMEAMGRA